MNKYIGVKEITDKIKNVQNNDFQAHHIIRVVTACKVVIIKNYKRNMSINLAQKRAAKILHNHKTKCNDCKRSNK